MRAASPAKSARRSQAERSAATRAALAEAAIDVLVERGWAAVSAVEVCRRAGVTRGAFHHHYASVPSLLADALGHAYATVGSRSRSRPTSVAELIDATWAAIGHRRFKAVLEAWLAMANDPRLRAEIGPVVARVAAHVRPDAIAASTLSDDERRDFYLMARETMLGLALGRATNGGKPLRHERRVLARIRREAAVIDARSPGARRS